MILKSLLKLLNFSENEIKVFSKLIEIGSQSASQIAYHIDMPRNTVRGILDLLTSKGFVNRSKKMNTHYYTQEKAGNIINSLKKLRTEFSDTINQQIKLIDTYKKKFNPKQSLKNVPKISFYEGLNGIIKIYEKTLESKETIRAFISYDHTMNILDDYIHNYLERRSKKKIGIRIITTDTKIALSHQSLNKNHYRECILLNHNEYKWIPEFQIFNNKIHIASLHEKIGIIIESTEIASAMKAFFDLAWIGAKSIEDSKYKKYHS